MKFSTWELVPNITDNRLEFMTQKSKRTDSIWRTEMIIYIYLDEIQYAEVIAKRCKNTVKFWSSKITKFSGNLTSLFLTQFNLKEVIKKFQ